MKHKIKPLGADRVKRLHCGVDTLAVTSADLINRMKGATITITDDEELMSERSVAHVKPHGIATVERHVNGKKPECSIEIALSPGKTSDDYDSLIAVKISGNRLRELSEAIALIDEKKSNPL